MDLVCKREKPGLMKERQFVHERYFQPVSNLGDNGAFRKKAKEPPANLEGKRCHKDAKGDHLGRKEQEGEGVAK